MKIAGLYFFLLLASPLLAEYLEGRYLDLCLQFNDLEHAYVVSNSASDRQFLVAEMSEVESEIFQVDTVLVAFQGDGPVVLPRSLPGVPLTLVRKP